MLQLLTLFNIKVPDVPLELVGIDPPVQGTQQHATQVIQEMTAPTVNDGANTAATRVNHRGETIRLQTWPRATNYPDVYYRRESQASRDLRSRVGRDVNHPFTFPQGGGPHGFSLQEAIAEMRAGDEYREAMFGEPRDPFG